MMPLMEYAPRTQNKKVETKITPESEVRRDRKSWTRLGRAAKAGNAVRAEREARAAGRSKSRRRSKSHGRDEDEPCGWYEMKRPGVWTSRRHREGSDWSPSSTTKQDEHGAKQSAPHKDLSNFLKLKEEVVKYPQNYIRRQVPAIYRTLGPDHEAVKSLSAFRDQARKFAAEIFTIVEWALSTGSYRSHSWCPWCPNGCVHSSSSRQ